MCQVFVAVRFASLDFVSLEKCCFTKKKKRRRIKVNWINRSLLWWRNCFQQNHLFYVHVCTWGALFSFKHFIMKIFRKLTLINPQTMLIMLSENVLQSTDNSSRPILRECLFCVSVGAISPQYQKWPKQHIKRNKQTGSKDHKAVHVIYRSIPKRKKKGRIFIFRGNSVYVFKSAKR